MSKIILLTTLLTAFLFPAAFHAQDEAEIRITIRRAPTGPDGKAVEQQAEDLAPIVLRAGGSEASILAAVTEHALGKNDSFQITFDNQSAADWSFLIVARSPDESCSSILPFLGFSDTGFVRDGEVPIGRVAAKSTVRSEWLTESDGGRTRFALLMSQRDTPLRNIFMAVEFLAGMATGRAEPKAADLAELKLGQPKGKTEAGEEYTSGRHRITVTLGSVYSESGEVLRSTEYYDALELIAECRYKYDRGSIPLDALRIGWLNNRGLANYQTGRLAEAKKDYESALAVIEKLKSIDGKPRSFERLVTHTNLAQVFATLGDQEAALSRYREAEKLSQTFPPVEIQPTLAAVYGGIGTSLEFQGKFTEALGYYEKALGLTRRHNLVASEGIILNSLGRLAASAGKRTEAEKYFADAIALSERTGNQAGIGSASNNLGWFLVKEKRFADAQAAFLRSSEIFERLGNRTAQATALGNLMFVLRLQDRPDAAIFFGKSSIRLLQSVRSGLTTVEKQLQRSFLLSREDTYRTLADILISRERLVEAQAVLELLKDEEHGGRPRTRSGGSNAEIVPYTDAEDSVQLKIDELANLRTQHYELQAEYNRLGDAFKKTAELESVEKSLVMVSNAFTRSLERLARTEVGVTDRVNTILGEQSLQSVLMTLRDEHNTEAVAIYTVLGTEETDDPRSPGGKKIRTKFGWAILVTPSDRKAYPIDVKDLEQTVMDFRYALATDEFDPEPLAKRLYEAIFRYSTSTQRRTLEKDLAAALSSNSNKTVMWSLDGVLRYVPMAALHDGSDYLVKKFRNVSFTSRSFAQLITANNPQWKILGLGVSEERPGFDALAGARGELEAIVGPGMFEGQILLNDKFRETDALRAWQSRRYPVIHIASHFKFNPAEPTASYLLVGDGELTVAELKAQNNIFHGVDLLALSACDTATQSNGKESETLAYLAQDLGARTVLASLWPVSDAGTPELMTRFYSLRASDSKTTKGEAFHRAQLSLLNGEKAAGAATTTRVTEPTTANTSGQGIRAKRLVLGGTSPTLSKFVPKRGKPFAHPYYWAPFILIGNWR